MKAHYGYETVFTIMFLTASLIIPGVASSSEISQQWEIINPESIVKVEPLKLNSHPTTLEGKTVALYWNGKLNGDNLLNRVAELLKEKVKDIKIIKVYEEKPATVGLRGPDDKSKAVAATIAAYKPDLVIASQAD